MASFRDVWEILIRADAKGAASEFDNVGNKIEGSGAKAAGWQTRIQGALDNVGQKVPVLGRAFEQFGVTGASVMTVGIPAAVGVAAGALVKLGEKFTGLALDVDRFSQKTGTIPEEASRWVEVANDLGVNTDALAGAVGRVNREAAAGQLRQYGVDASNAS